MQSDGRFHYPTAYDWVYQHRSAPDIDHAMVRTIGQCEAMRPHPDWALLKRLPYAEDAARCAAVAVDRLRREPPARSLQGAYFGIYPMVNDAGEDVQDVAFTGLAQVHPPQGPDDIIYRPSDGFLGSKAIAAIARIANRPNGGLENAAEYTLCLAQAMFVGRSSILDARGAGLLEEISVFAGFHDGDEIDLGVL